MIAWTLLRGLARAAFRDALGGDDGLWARGRGWAVWKALITFDDPASRATLAAVLDDANGNGAG